MYVCLCKGVTDKQITRAVENGACTMRDLRQQFGVGTQCGKCTCHARDVLHESLHARPDVIEVPVRDAAAPFNADVLYS
ncbi:bacterioferritin-associated ferredoxin [Aliidiomarina indica]|uniref:bacterioferritin-associated ferredoxin n=1 Tax=Aliidiomarina indica TaxID=2749147 RepID=UPI00188E0CDC|nr:bacterioferritin-associated ferredoxin [Aliidiomarina indica]